MNPARRFSVASLSVLLCFLFSCDIGVRAQESLSCLCKGPYYCDGNDSCEVNAQNNKSLACVFLIEFHEDGKTLQFATCAETNAFDINIYCEPEVQVKTRKENGIIWKTIVRYCCYTAFCNSLEAAINESKVTNSSLPPIFTSPPATLPPTTISSATHSGTTPHTAVSNSTSTTSPSTPVYAVVVIVALSFTVILILAIIVVVLLLHWYPRHFSHLVKGSSMETAGTSFPVDTDSYSDPSLNELLEDSGSGSGLPLLIQRSISGQITLYNLIGKGRFGEVWKGVYKGDEVAVKIFHTKEELSWFHEVEVYQTCLLRHPNLLRFIAADNKDVGLQMQLWLISEFCEFGSLFDLLTRQTFDQATALRLCFTAACGIDHLHTEIVGTQAKPAIAHRDLKSRNILVKADYSCCIADLGLALRYEQATNTIKEPPRTTVGTKRYLAPEILSENIAAKNFESFKRSDIYSFGLVMWEIGRRAECDGHAEEAQLPYFDLIPSDPTLEEVRRLVCVERRRPSVPNTWNQHETMTGLAKIIRQCWLHEAEARLTSLRIKKSLANLQEMRKETKEQEQT